jgi:hypothetical protein
MMLAAAMVGVNFLSSFRLANRTSMLTNYKTNKKPSSFRPLISVKNGRMGMF